MMKHEDVWFIALCLAGVLLVSVMFTNMADEEAFDDDICQNDQVRARISYEVVSDHHESTRCISLDEYRTLDFDGRIVHPTEAPR